MTKPGLAHSDNPDCLNCGTALRGQYCGHCGQRSNTRLISLWELMREAFGDLLELDSRLWRTLRPLLTKPGQLTKDYLLGRRARYMPPFRTYLVLSVIFFVVAFFNPRDDFDLLFEPPPEVAAGDSAENDDNSGMLGEAGRINLEAAQEVLDELADEGIITPNIAENLDKDDLNIRLGEDDNGNCDIDAEDRAQFPDWLARRLTEKRLQRLCDRIILDEGETFTDMLLDRIPVALIVLLPFMAFVLKLLYPMSRRYFVEHLLFFVHFHAFFFLILTLQIVFGRLAGWLALPEAIPILIIVAASFYVPVYLYLAMRRVYDQGHLATSAKYVVLMAAYVAGAALTLLGATFFALISV